MEKLTTKQRGDAAEHYVISMLGFNNIPASKMPDNWPGYDLVAQLPGNVPPSRISVKFCTYSKAAGSYVGYEPRDQFDFIALVVKYPTGFRTWILPRAVADATALNPGGSKSGKFTKREWQIKSIENRFPTYENNFGLAVVNAASTPGPDAMAHIAISAAAYDVIARTLQVEAVALEFKVDAKGERSIRLDKSVARHASRDAAGRGVLQRRHPAAGSRDRRGQKKIPGRLQRAAPSA